MARKRRLNEQEIIQKNLEYCREQLVRFLKKYYRIDFRGKLYGNKTLHKAPYFKYSQVEFLPDGSANVRISTEILIGSGEKMRGLQLRAVQREGIRIALYNKRIDYSDKSIAFKRELAKRGLPDYDGFPEMGLDLHTYVCAECKKIWALQTRELPKNKNPTIPYKNKKTGKYVTRLTGCCQAPFIYTGVKHYDNEKLRKYAYLTNKNTDSLGEKSSGGDI